MTNTTSNPKGQKHLTTVLGLGTYRALVALYSDAAEWLRTETNPEEIAILTARATFLRTARVTKWKAILTFPTDATTRAILAEDLADWGKPNSGLIPEFEKYSPNLMIRGAFARIANELTTITR